MMFNSMWQPLYCFQIDMFAYMKLPVVRQCLHLCILNVLGEVLGIWNLYCGPLYLAESGLCVKPKDFKNQLLNVVLANCCPLPPLISKQTPTALLVDGQRQLRDSVQQVIDFIPCLLRKWPRPPRRTSLRHLEHMTGVMWKLLSAVTCTQ